MTSFSQNSSNLLLALATVRRCATPVPCARIIRNYGSSVLGTMMHMGLVRNSASFPGCVVTVKHKRPVIDAMTNKIRNSGLDLSAVRPTPTVANVEFHQNKNAQTMTLAYIFRAPHAVHMDAIAYMLRTKGINDLSASNAIDDLLKLGLIRAHRDNAKCFFVRANKRAIAEKLTNKVKADAFPVRRAATPVQPSAADLYAGTASHLARR